MSAVAAHIPAASRSERVRLAIVLAVGVLFVAGILLEIDALNGTWYWRRPWRDSGFLHTAALLALPLLPFALALREIEHPRAAARSAWPALLLLMIANLGFQLGGMLRHPQGLAWLDAIVTSPNATSYFTDARRIDDIATWLANFHLAGLELHSSTHPPGPILFYSAFIGMFGAAGAARAGGIALGAIATLAIPLLYAFGGLWSRDRRERLLSCAMYALMPAAVAFFPEFDQIYPVFAMLVALTWIGALRGSPMQAVAFGAVVFAMTFFAWNLLAMLAFVGLYSLYFLRRERGSVDAVRRVGAAAMSALATFVLLEIALRLATGYDAPRSLAHALAMQREQAALIDRPWWACVLLDPYDFLLGAGVLAAPLLAFFLVRARADASRGREDVALSLIGLATILAVDLSGLLRAETARVWLFLQPFAIVPAARELLPFGARGRLLVFALQWLILVALLARLSFVDP